MTIKKYFKKITVLALFLFHLSALAAAQTTNLPAPREEKLLNGMKLLVWSDQKAAKTSVRLRIHSGSAFDPQAREGVMALLGDILFPNQTSQEYFAEDLGGSLEVTSNYDYIQISATGDNDKILEMLEAIAQAITISQIDKETTAKVKTARLEKLKELEKDPAYLADRAVARQLFGNYPYGRPQLGTTESVSKIDFADMLLARQKFLTADNATLAISGNVKFDLVFRAVRRYFGGWTKADKKVPATFTQPAAPAEKPLLINSPSVENEEVLMAFHGFARNDKDFYAARILTKILANRPKTSPGDFVKSESYLLDGIFFISGKPVPSSIDKNASKNQFTQEEFEKAKAEMLVEVNQKNLSDWWLDVDTYKLTSVKDELQKANNIKFEDARQAFDKLQTQPKVVVIFSKTAANTSTKTN